MTRKKGPDWMERLLVAALVLVTLALAATTWLALGA